MLATSVQPVRHSEQEVRDNTVAMSATVRSNTASFHAGDVNECLVNNGGCQQICTNTDGSFMCSCNTGYVLAGNGLGCNGTCA